MSCFRARRAGLDFAGLKRFWVLAHRVLNSLCVIRMMDGDAMCCFQARQDRADFVELKLVLGLGARDFEQASVSFRTMEGAERSMEWKKSI